MCVWGGRVKIGRHKDFLRLTFPNVIPSSERKGKDQRPTGQFNNTLNPPPPANLHIINSIDKTIDSWSEERLECIEDANATQAS